MKHVEVRPGIYRDSVALMRISADLTTTPGVTRALVALATPLNLELLTDLGFTAPPAAPNDLVVAVAAQSQASLTQALDRLAQALRGPEPSAADTSELAVAPRTTASAARSAPGGIALVSTPGPHAFAEAMDALEAGLSVMVFSDNVPVEQEVRLKEYAAQRGLLVMGPDCGTAVVGGVGLGFANVVRPGPVGIVAASGTGAQQVMALLAAAGVGVSHCLGVGGRDLSAAVDGRATHTALDALDADPGTELILVLSKPPAPTVADAVRDHAQRLATPTVLALDLDTTDLSTVVEKILSTLDIPVPAWPTWAPAQPRRSGPGMLRGLYGGGTLCVEAQATVAPLLGELRSNAPLRPQWRLAPGGPQRRLESGDGGHVLLDLGADEYTAGRPHPMLEPAVRVPWLTAAADDDDVAVILLDVVLGHGAHPDPASVLAPALRPVRQPVVVALVGTPDDPQGLDRQAAALVQAGAEVFLSNAQAARHAATLAGRTGRTGRTGRSIPGDTADSPGRTGRSIPGDTADGPGRTGRSIPGDTADGPGRTGRDGGAS